MNHLKQLVVFLLDDQKFAFRLSSVVKIIRVVEIRHLPKAPEIVLGVINVQGQIIPVFDVRKRFRLPERDVQLSDQLMIVRTSKRAVAFHVDSVSDVVEIPEQKIAAAGDVLPDLDYVEGVVKTEEGLIVIHDINSFLSLEEENSLDRSLSKRKSEK
jgi:purine-binding chemotaxis protein CheW